MSRDIASQVISEMGMTPQMADELHRSQMAMQPGYGMAGGGMPGYGMPGGYVNGGMPQSMIPNQMQQPPQQYQPQPMGPPDVSTESSSNDDEELKKLGLGQSSFMSYIKGPLIVMVIVFVLCLTQVDGLLKGLLPILNGYKLVAAKAVMGGLIYLGSLLVIGH